MQVSSASFFRLLLILVTVGMATMQAPKTDQKLGGISSPTDKEKEQKALGVGMAPPPLDCDEIYKQGAESDGVYLIYPGGPHNPIPVYCDMTTDDGKWTVFQKRFNGSVNFFRGWTDYKLGFGRADGEYWLGLQNIHLLTLKKAYELRVDLEDFENSTAFAKYADFSISPNAINAEEDGYTLHVDDFSDGGAGDSLSYHSGMKFSTFDRDQDQYVQNCAALSSGAFWFKTCHLANLNGLYLQGSHLTYANGINWAQWKGFYYSLRRSEMKIRPAA